ncbi:hypothetical protein NA57DRAFT_54736 [Rhizodiscina lignyota]|uniref:G-patch domain-containing protein n=1 Tax=Rhizodiscina lignyota TaxID=1504668 RepID=A0A9P4M839_9PEZI|nr:hypothetical protein NA57DRAFT_54736 [Rhizodiscina lignyota]
MSSNTEAEGGAPKRKGLSLYANLLDPEASTPGSVTRAPVLFKQPESQQQDAEAAAKKQVNTALRFPPTKRPQLQSQKQKAKTTFPKGGFLPTSSSSPDATAKAGAPRPPPVKSTIADWTADDDDANGFYAGDQHNRGRKWKKRKKNNKEAARVVLDWGDVYEVSIPDNFGEYKHSDEWIQQSRDWKDRLYAHRSRAYQDSDLSSDDEDAGATRMNPRFAPPSNYNFAPPPPSDEQPKVPPPPPVEIDRDETADEVYARRMRMSQAQQPPPPPPVESLPLPPPPGAPPALQPEPLKPTMHPALAAMQSPTISRTPVRYNLPPPPAELPSEAELEKALAQDEEAPTPPSDAPTGQGTGAEEDAPRSNRPGREGFAKRFMEKYGWSKGQGLGAQGTGITTALRVEVEKRKKKSDAEGGGYVNRARQGKIVGGKKNVSEEEEVGKFGAMSEVVVLKGMLGGMDVQTEMEGGLVQEIGEECGEKYGRVERVYVWRDGENDEQEEGPPVFVKFTSQLSALRAVNALDGRIFNGNAIRARFFNTDKFESGEYE